MESRDLKRLPFAREETSQRQPLRDRKVPATSAGLLRKRFPNSDAAREDSAFFADQLKRARASFHPASDRDLKIDRGRREQTAQDRPDADVRADFVANPSCASTIREGAIRRDRQTVRRKAANNSRAWEQGPHYSLRPRTREVPRKMSKPISRETKSPELAPGASVSLETASLLEMETQTALELVESKVGVSTGVTEIGATLEAYCRKSSRVALGAKIDIEISKVQPPMLTQADVESASGCPATANLPVSIKLEVYSRRIVRRR